MSAVRKPSLSDPLSLDGLEPLLDQIFSVQYDFVPRDASQTVLSNSGAIDFGAEVDFNPPEGKEDFSSWVLSEKLNATVLALKAYQDKCRWLELKLATKDDQLEYVPELFSKALMLTSVQAENEEFKRENRALLETIEQIKPKEYQPSMGRRILNRFFGA